jgi:hypothetical protein
MKLAPYSTAVALLFFILAAGVGRAAAQGPLQSSGSQVSLNVYGLTSDGELIPLVWANVTATNSNYRFVNMGTSGIFLPPGTYNLSVTYPGVKPYNGTLTVSEGSSSNITVYLYESGVPVPEFPVQTASIVMIMTLGAAVLLTKKATKRSR